jgi:hypothetical protein
LKPAATRGAGLRSSDDSGDGADDRDDGAGDNDDEAGDDDGGDDD